MEIIKVNTMKITNLDVKSKMNENKDRGKKAREGINRGQGDFFYLNLEFNFWLQHLL